MKAIKDSFLNLRNLIISPIRVFPKNTGVKVGKNVLSVLNVALKYLVPIGDNIVEFHVFINCPIRVTYALRAPRSVELLKGVQCCRNVIFIKLGCT